MANGIAAQIGQQVSKAGFGGTDDQGLELIRLFTLDKIQPAPAGLTTAQLTQYYLDAAIPEIKAYIKREAAKNGLREEQAKRINENAVDSKLSPL
jgi:hypothetical protein